MPVPGWRLRTSLRRLDALALEVGRHADVGHDDLGVGRPGALDQSCRSPRPPRPPRCPPRGPAGPHALAHQQVVVGEEHRDRFPRPLIACHSTRLRAREPGRSLSGCGGASIPGVTGIGSSQPSDAPPEACVAPTIRTPPTAAGGSPCSRLDAGAADRAGRRTWLHERGDRPRGAQTEAHSETPRSPRRRPRDRTRASATVHPGQRQGARRTAGSTPGPRPR